MIAEILKIEQSFDVETGELTNFAVMRLPNGVVVQAVLSEEDTAAVVDAASPEEPEYEEAVDMEPELAEPAAVEETKLAAPAEDEDLITWSLLPASILDPQVREVLEGAKLPERIPEAALRELIASVRDGLVEEARAALAKPVAPAAPSAPRVQEAPRPRTVSKDEAGNPIVPRNAPPVIAHDPGEVVDEDGVAQL